MAAGFVDLQVNGYAGRDFTSATLTDEDVAAASAELARRGTAGYCPTVITTSLEVYEHVLPILARACRAASSAAPQSPREASRGLSAAGASNAAARRVYSRPLGLHLEGPFISSDDGAVGAHPKDHVLAPSAGMLDHLMYLADGQVRLLTLAPETKGATSLISYARQLGIAVSIGHTLAGADHVKRAVAAGARLSTHLANGCPNQIHRHENPIWPQLACGDLSAMIITDGHHLPPAVIASILAAKGPRRTIVTSDSVSVAGLPPGEYETMGLRVLLEPSGRVRNAQAPTLAGSSACMLDCMNHLASLGLLEIDDLWRVGRDNALAAIGASADDLAAGVSVEWDGRRFTAPAGNFGSPE